MANCRALMYRTLVTNAQHLRKLKLIYLGRQTSDKQKATSSEHRNATQTSHIVVISARGHTLEIAREPEESVQNSHGGAVCSTLTRGFCTISILANLARKKFGSSRPFCDLNTILASVNFTIQIFGQRETEKFVQYSQMLNQCLSCGRLLRM